MTLYIHLSDRSPLPRYRQIEQQVRFALTSASLMPGDRLPAVRELASRLGVNPATIIQAYDELEREGLIVRKQGSGTFVAGRPSGDRLARRRLAVEILETAAADIATLDLPIEEMTALFHDRLARFTGNRRGKEKAAG